LTVDDSCQAPAHHGHAESLGGVGDEAADRAQSDDAERPLWQLEPREVLLSGLHGLAQLVVGAFEVAGEVPRLADLAAADDQACDHQFLDGIRIGAGRVEHGDAAIGHLRHRNVVDAGARPPDGFEALGNLAAVHVGRTQQNRVGVFHVVADLIRAGRQSGQTDLGNVIERQHFEHEITPTDPCRANAS
jgi:hypothetical protein